MTTHHVLSDEDFDRCVGVPWRPGDSLRARMNAAYQLGVERGKAERREFICSRCGIRQDSKPSGESPF